MNWSIKIKFIQKFNVNNDILYKCVKSVQHNRLNTYFFSYIYIIKYIIRVVNFIRIRSSYTFTHHTFLHIPFVNISINKSGFVCMYKEPLHNINDVPKINNHGDHRFSK